MIRAMRRSSRGGYSQVPTVLRVLGVTTDRGRVRELAKSVLQRKSVKLLFVMQDVNGLLLELIYSASLSALHLVRVLVWGLSQRSTRLRKSG